MRWRKRPRADIFDVIISVFIIVNISLLLLVPQAARVPDVPRPTEVSPTPARIPAAAEGGSPTPARIPAAAEGGSPTPARIPARTTPPPTKTPEPYVAALGAYISGAPWDPAKIDQFGQMIGAMPAIVMWYQGWGGGSTSKFAPELLDAVVARGAVPMITWEPWDYSSDPANDQYALRRIAAGDHDAYIRGWARAAAAWNKRLYLRFAHEMNGDWYPWGAGVNENTAADYVAAWRHIVDIFRAEGAGEVRWVWSPNVEYPGSAPLAELYPGDGYVDWVALDGYNHGTVKSPGAWRDLIDIFAPSYAELVALTQKPIMIAEIASVELGGDKAAWIRQGLLRDLPERMPRVRAVIWFHETKDPKLDWRVDSSSQALAAFRDAARSPIYRGRLS